MESSNGGTINNNKFYNLDNCITCIHSTNIVISDNIFNEFKNYGIALYDACNLININNNTITNSNAELHIFSDSQGSGIYLEDSYRNTAESNKIYDCNYGIYIYHGDFNEVLKNDVRHNQVALFELGTFFNKIHHNNFCSSLYMELVAVFSFGFHPNNFWGSVLTGYILRTFRVIAGMVILFPFSTVEF
jgi:parallel beta-helix repeat protein